VSYILRRKGLGKGSCEGIAENLLPVDVGVCRSDQELPEEARYVFRWGCTATIPSKSIVVNEAKAIHFVADKMTSRMKFAELELSPDTWTNILLLPQDGGPYIVRPQSHAQGKDCHYAENNYKASEAAYLCGDNYYISDYIPKVAEYRVFVVQGRVAWVANKVPGDVKDIAWNVAQGGRFENVKFGDWNLEAVRVAIEAMAIADLDFGGVDVMVDVDNNAYVLEINSAASHTSPYRKLCTARCFNYILAEGKGRIPTVGFRSWKNFIHPAISDKAII